MAGIMKKHLQGDQVIWVVMIILMIFSLLAVYSSTGTLAYEYKGGNTSFYLMRHGMFMLMALFVTYVVHRIHYRYYAWLSSVLVYLAVLLLLFTLVLGVTHNEATRWLTVPGVGIEFQTSDFAKFALLMFVAKVLSQSQKDVRQREQAFKSIMIASAVIGALILPENFSTAALLMLTVGVMMYVGRIEAHKLWVAAGMVLAGILLFIAVAWMGGSEGRIGTWKNRIESYVSPGEDDNYQANQAKIAIVSGGLLGKGPGNSTQRNILPHPYSDFIYAIIIEEYGSLGGFVALMFYLILLYRGGRIVTRCGRTFPAFLVIGVILSITFQALINMAVAVNLFPVTGQTLPFISMGGTSLLFTSIGLGIVLGISRVVDEEGADEQEAQHA